MRRHHIGVGGWTTIAEGRLDWRISFFEYQALHFQNYNSRILILYCSWRRFSGASAIKCWWGKHNALLLQHFTGEFEVSNYGWLQIRNKSYYQKEMMASYPQQTVEAPSTAVPLKAFLPLWESSARGVIPVDSITDSSELNVNDSSNLCQIQGLHGAQLSSVPPCKEVMGSWKTT